MQQLDPTWNPHLQLEYFKVCVRPTLSTLGQITSSIEAQELIQLETTSANLYNYKEQLILNNKATEHTTQEIDIDIEIIKSQIQIIKNKKSRKIDV
jgi:hypothetical protein